MAQRRADPPPADHGVFMISVAAELAGMHPQTLRMYEARGLITPSRSPKRTRLYSQRDIERLRRIHRLTTEMGMNLAGVERVLAMEQAMRSLQERMERMQAETERLHRELAERIEQVHRSYRRELVRWQPPGAVARREDVRRDAFTIPIRRKDGSAAREPRAQGHEEPGT
jgi:MerR family transcriptional regulator/heat shock protein HspR